MTEVKITKDGNITTFNIKWFALTGHTLEETLTFGTNLETVRNQAIDVYDLDMSFVDCVKEVLEGEYSVPETWSELLAEEIEGELALVNLDNFAPSHCL
tara:strand:+ start:526 stop:822 length:297 start_codon:yes stop_codon:yes gene_type:complete